jgi:hypothetical protein
MKLLNLDQSAARLTLTAANSSVLNTENVAKAACSLTSEYVRFKGLKGSFEPAEPAARVCLIAAWRKLEQFE